MTGTPEQPAPKGVGDELEALLLQAADRLHEPAPSLINKLSPIHWPAAAKDEIRLLAQAIIKKGSADTLEGAQEKAQRMLERKFAQRFVVQVFVRVMGVPLLQPKPPVPDDYQICAMAEAIGVFANGDLQMLGSIALEAYKFRMPDLASILVASYLAPATELASYAEAEGDLAFAARMRKHLEPLEENEAFLTTAQLNEMLYGGDNGQGK